VERGRSTDLKLKTIPKRKGEDCAIKLNLASAQIRIGTARKGEHIKDHGR